MLHIQEIETHETWDAMREQCTVSASPNITAQVVLTRDEVNTFIHIRERARIQCASAVFETLYGDLRQDIAEMLLMLQITHPDQARVAQIEYKMVRKLGTLR